MNSDEEYFAQLADDERVAAELAKDSDAREVHLELAEEHDELSAALERAHRPSLSQFA